MSTRKVVILGATGSIGTQALDVIRTRRGQFEVAALSAGGGNLSLLAEQIVEFGPHQVGIAGGDSDELRDRVAQTAAERGSAVPSFELTVGEDASTRLAALPADVVLNGITGAAGLLPTLETLAAGTTLALANKESLVIGGRLVTEAGRPGQIVAVDSEHSAFAQALRSGRASEVRKLILTASGGPFRGWSAEQLASVTPDQAMAHPTWDMGRVITINSATLVNKGLELLEAGLLYDVPLDAIEVVVHPQSIVHSMVEFVDGSTLAQCSPPDMRLPIGLGLTWPDRLPDAAVPCDWGTAATWTFEPLDVEVFEAVEVARECGMQSGTAPAVYNAANEIAVDAFCEGKLRFSDIVPAIKRTLAAHTLVERPTVADVLAADAWARDTTRAHIGANIDRDN